MLSQKRIRRKTLQNSDPGKILNLVMSLEVELCSHLQNKINSYVSIYLFICILFKLINVSLLIAEIGRYRLLFSIFIISPTKLR